MIEKNLTRYQPWWPHARLIRTRGEIRQTALVVIWWKVVLNIDLTKK